jgi:hypothetical protein
MGSVLFPLFYILYLVFICLAIFRNLTSKKPEHQVTPKFVLFALLAGVSAYAFLKAEVSPQMHDLIGVIFSVWVTMLGTLPLRQRQKAALERERVGSSENP